MTDSLKLNVPLLRRRVPNLTVAARAAGLRPATVSDLCTGRIPLGRAEVRTLVALADLAGCSLDDLVIRGAGAELIETGIKVLDLFAPLVRGGSVGLVARQGLGQMVVLQELIHRLRGRSFATIAWLPEQADRHMQDTANLAEARGLSSEEVLQHIAAAGTDRDVLVVADRVTVLSGEMDALRERLNPLTTRPVTFALVDALGQTPDEQAPYGPLESLWRFDIDLAARGMHPATDPVASASTLLEGEHLDSAHLAVQRRAAKLMRRYRELCALARVRGEGAIPEAEAITYRRGERLEAFLTQPFYVAEAFTGTPGEWVSLPDTVEGVRRILDGAVDALAPQDLAYKGGLPST